MTTLTIDIYNDEALDLIKELEQRKAIHVRKKPATKLSPDVDFAGKYLGAISPQPLSEVDKQLAELRNAWE